MIIVLDVSAAIEILLQKEKKELFNGTYKEASWVIAPDLFVSEISNVLWKYYKAKIITHADCMQYVEDGIDMIDDFIEAKELWKEALGEGIKNNHSIYDMYYSVLARRNDATLITNDGSLATICKKLKIIVCN
jgi:predicted nucleic acid-binding protein